MKKLVGLDCGSYVFDPINKTITINNLDTLQLEQILLITNVTDNIMLYNFADPELGATILNNVITLDYDTSTMSTTDSLQIFIEVQDIASLLIGLTNQISLLTDMVKSLSNVDALNRQVVVVASAPTTAVNGTVSLGGSVAEVGKVTQTYSDTQMLSQVANNQAVQKFTFS